MSDPLLYTWLYSHYMLEAEGEPDVDEGFWTIWKLPDGIEAIYDNPEASPYKLTLVIETSGAEPAIRKLLVSQYDGGQAVTASGLRDAPIWIAASTSLGVYEDLAFHDHLAAVQPPGREPRNDNTAAVAAQVVEFYRRAVARGSRRPTADTAKVLGYSRSNVGRILVDARRGRWGEALRIAGGRKDDTK